MRGVDECRVVAPERGDRGRRIVGPPQLSSCRSDRKEHRRGMRHVCGLGMCQGCLEFSLAVVIDGERQVVPAGVLPVQIHRPPDERCATFPIARVREQHAHVGHRHAQRVELDDSLGGHAEPVQIALDLVTNRDKPPPVLARGVELERAIGRRPRRVPRHQAADSSTRVRSNW